MINFNALHEFSDEDSGRVYVNNTEVKQVFFNGEEVYAHKRWRPVFEGSRTIDLTAVLKKYTSGTDFTDHTETVHANFPGIRAGKPIRISYTARFVDWNGYYKPEMDTWTYAPDQSGTLVEAPITFIFRYSSGTYYKDPVGQIDIPTQANTLDIFTRCIAQGSRNYGMWFNTRSYMPEITITKIEQYF